MACAQEAAILNQRDRDAAVAQNGREGAFVHVRSLDAVAGIKSDFGKRADADAADSGKEYVHTTQYSIVTRGKGCYTEEK